MDEKIMVKPKLLIMVGNIVSGKFTWIKKFLELDRGKDFVVVSKDDLRRMIGAGRYVFDEKLEPIIHSCFIDILGNFMSKGINIICDETNMDKDTRSGFLHLAHGYKYEAIAVVIFNPSEEEIKKRIALREGHLEWAATSKEIWMEIWKRKQALYQELTKEEEFNSICKIKLYN